MADEGVTLVADYEKGPDGNLTDDGHRQLSLDAIKHFDDFGLREVRRVCFAGKMSDVKVGTEAKGSPFPKVEKYCLGVLQETAKRGQLSVIYGNHGRKVGAGADELREAITAAAVADQTYFTLKGGRYALSCPMAFDAAFSSAHLNNDMDAPNQKLSATYLKAKLPALRGACYDPVLTGKNIKISATGEIVGIANVGAISGYHSAKGPDIVSSINHGLQGENGKRVTSLEPRMPVAKGAAVGQ